MYATKQIVADSMIVSCPFSLVITKESARLALVHVLTLPETEFELWTERMLIATYLALHSVLKLLGTPM